MKPAAELSVSTSDAFTALCSGPQEYFPPSLISMAAAFSLIPASAIMCLEKHTSSSQLRLNPVGIPVFPVGFLPFVYSSILFPLWLILRFHHLFLNFSPLFHLLSPVLGPAVWGSAPAALPPPCILLVNRVSNPIFLLSFANLCFNQQKVVAVVEHY